MLSFAVVLINACNKKDSVPEKTTAEKIAAKWSLAGEIYRDSTAAGITTNTRAGLAGEYVDFRTDGKYYSFVSTTYDTGMYKILSDSKIVFDGDTADIKVLTDNDFTFYNKYQDGFGSYESTINLKK